MAELRKVIYTPHIYIIRLNIEGEEHTAVMREQQFHPVSDALLHVDFYVVSRLRELLELRAEERLLGNCRVHA